jgi:hypothetical protein
MSADPQGIGERADNRVVASDVALCSACGGDVVHLGAELNVEIGLCPACVEALRLVEQAGRSSLTEPVLVPPPT